jgi:thiamine pyrophosphate-dependent acetolactate synthase large subunit-like protein
MIETEGLTRAETLLRVLSHMGRPSPDYAMIARAFEGYGEKVEEPGEVRAALQRGLKAVAGGQVALIDIRLAKAAETNERPDRAN